MGGVEVANGKMPATVGGHFGVDTFGVGEDSCQPVAEAYQPLFCFTGETKQVVIEVD